MNSSRPSDAVRFRDSHSQEVEMPSPLRLTSVALALGAASTLLCAGAAVAAAQRTGSVRGTVTDAVTGRPVDGAQVTVVGTEIGTLTNAAGQFQFNVQPGSITLRTRRVGYGSMNKAVTVTAGDGATADFALSPAAVGLDVVVVTGTGTE